jgi:hypothetical protein
LLLHFSIITKPKLSQIACRILPTVSLAIVITVPFSNSSAQSPATHFVPSHHSAYLVCSFVLHVRSEPPDFDFPELDMVALARKLSQGSTSAAVTYPKLPLARPCMRLRTLRNVAILGKRPSVGCGS